MADPCADTSAALDEPVAGTASLVRGWLLVEQPGAWGPDALFESRFPRRLARALVPAARAHGARIVLLRRTDRHLEEGRHAFACHSGRARPWTEHRVLDHPRDLAGVDLAAFTRPEPAGFGRPWPRPLYLVCTNGRHDPCCARLGRPVARSLSAAGRPGQVWECSHIGGDRFAANLICLPHGLYFGRLGPEEAAAAVAAYEAGRIDLDHYRGRAGDPFAVQAAEAFLRRETGEMGVEAVALQGWHREGGTGDVHARFTVGGGPEEVEVRVAVDAGAPRLLTCTAGAQGRPPIYRLVDVIPRPPVPPELH